MAASEQRPAESLIVAERPIREPGTQSIPGVNRRLRAERRPVVAVGLLQPEPVS
jgi:hypothetical protein